MKKISYSEDVDALLIELSDGDIAYAEDDGEAILHYSEDDKLLVVEILHFRRLLSEKAVSQLFTAA